MSINLAENVALTQLQSLFPFPITAYNPEQDVDLLNGNLVRIAISNDIADIEMNYEWATQRLEKIKNHNIGKLRTKKMRELKAAQPQRIIELEDGSYCKITDNDKISIGDIVLDYTTNSFFVIMVNDDIYKWENVNPEHFKVCKPVKVSDFNEVKQDEG